MDFYNFTDNFILWGLILGCFISYIPQYKKIYENQNTLGINETMIISGYFSCLLNIIGSIQENYDKISNCHDNCYNTLIPTIQICAPFICSLILYILYICYFSNYEKNKFAILDIHILTRNIKLRRRVRIRSMISFLSTFFLFIIFILLNKYETIDNIKIIGKISNIVSGILSLIMWYPQLYTTYKLENNHSLSLIALTIHAIGCLITIIYQWIFELQDVLILLCYIVSMISEISIVALSVYYKRRKKKLLMNEHLII